MNLAICGLVGGGEFWERWTQNGHRMDTVGWTQDGHSSISNITMADGVVFHHFFGFCCNNCNFKLFSTMLHSRLSLAFTSVFLVCFGVVIQGCKIPQCGLVSCGIGFTCKINAGNTTTCPFTECEKEKSPNCVTCIQVMPECKQCPSEDSVCHIIQQSCHSCSYAICIPNCLKCPIIPQIRCAFDINSPGAPYIKENTCDQCGYASCTNPNSTIEVSLKNSTNENNPATTTNKNNTSKANTITNNLPQILILVLISLI